jgi:predicted enzyme involved in methoxymalonyl-ACP biosynthesis
LQIYTHAYGSALQELNDPESGLAASHPDVVLISYPYAHLFGARALAKTPEAVEDQLFFASSVLRNLRDLVREKFGSAIIQQAVLPTALPLVGNHEFQLPGSPARLVAQLNQRLREQAAAEKFSVLAIDDVVANDGLAAWHDRALWHRAKQEISPGASLAYGELVLQVIDGAARPRREMSGARSRQYALGRRHRR